MKLQLLLFYGPQMPLSVKVEPIGAPVMISIVLVCAPRLCSQAVVVVLDNLCWSNSPGCALCLGLHKEDHRPCLLARLHPEPHVDRDAASFVCMQQLEAGQGPARTVAASALKSSMTCSIPLISPHAGHCNGKPGPSH